MIRYMAPEMLYLVASIAAFIVGVRDVAGFFLLCWLLWVGLGVWGNLAQKFKKA